MAVQMTFAKHPTIKQYFTATHNSVNYLVTKSAFGWHARFNDPKYGPRYLEAGARVHDNRGQAEYACNLHANGGL